MSSSLVFSEDGGGGTSVINRGVYSQEAQEVLHIQICFAGRSVIDNAVELVY